MGTGRPTVTASAGCSVCQYRLPGQCSPVMSGLQSQGCTRGLGLICPGLPAFRPSGLPRLPTWPCLPDDEGVRARRKQKNKSTGKVEHRFKTLPPSTVTTTEQGQAKQLSNNKKLMALSLGSSCMFVDLTQHCNQVMYAYIYEPHAYHNLLLPKISAQIQRYGFQAEPERVLESFFVSCK